jgi:hypothetical protein
VPFVVAVVGLWAHYRDGGKWLLAEAAALSQVDAYVRFFAIGSWFQVSNATVDRCFLT